MGTRPVVGPQNSINERLVALEIVRQVLLLRYSLHVRDLVVKALNNTEQPVASMIRDMLRTDPGMRDPAQVRQVQALIDQINALRQPAWQAGRVAVEAELTTLAEQAEPEDQRDLLGFLLPGVSLLMPGLGVGASMLLKPFGGRTMRQWFDDAAADDAKRIGSAIQMGTGLGEDPAATARRVVGTANAKGRDGTTQISRNHVDTIVRSGVVHASGYGRDQFYRANAEAMYVFPVGLPRVPVRPVGAPEDPAVAAARRQVQAALAAADSAAGGRGRGGSKLFELEQYVAVLDGRTTKLCRGLDGKRYAVGVGPIPPLHPNCRSNRVIVLPEEVGGPLYDPGTYADWIRRQPDAVWSLLMGSASRDDDLADAAFRDYGAKPMSLSQVRDEARRIMAFY